jgi:hypothetical protein
LYGSLRRTAVRHFDETKATGSAGETIGDDSDSIHRSIRLKELAEVLLRSGHIQVAYKDMHGGFPSERVHTSPQARQNFTDIAGWGSWIAMALGP